VLCFIAAIFGCLLLIITVLLGDSCDELDYQLVRKPGILQWWVVPYCTGEAPFDAYKQQIIDTETQNSIDACTQLDDICSQSSAFDPAFPDEIFTCPTLSDPNQCQTLEDVTAVFDSLTIKPGAAGACTVPGCTVQNCTTACTSSSTRDTSTNAVNSLDYATRAKRAYVLYLEDLLDCNFIIDLVVGAFDDDCRDWETANRTLGAGAAVYASMFLLGIIVLILGQKRFFSSSEAQEARTPYGGYPANNAVAPANNAVAPQYNVKK